MMGFKKKNKQVYTVFKVGEEVKIKNCLFKISYINKGKNRLTLEPVLKKVNE